MCSDHVGRVVLDMDRLPHLYQTNDFMGIISILLATIRFYLAWMIAFPLHFVSWLVGCCVYPRDKWGHLSYTLAKSISLMALKVSGIQLRIKLEGDIPEQGPLIVVANHQSYLDIIAVVAAIPHQIAFVAKRELLAIPFLGWNLKAQHHLIIDRSKPKEAMSQLISLAPLMAERQQVVVFFPEGTRSPTETMGRFKSGAFELAHAAGATVLPVAIKGSGRIFGKTSHWVRYGSIDVVVTPPLPPTLSSNELKETAFLRIQTAMEPRL